MKHRITAENYEEYKQFHYLITNKFYIDFTLEETIKFALNMAIGVIILFASKISILFQTLGIAYIFGILLYVDGKILLGPKIAVKKFKKAHPELDINIKPDKLEEKIREYEQDLRKKTTIEKCKIENTLLDNKKDNESLLIALYKEKEFFENLKNSEEKNNQKIIIKK